MLSLFTYGTGKLVTVFRHNFIVPIRIVTFRGIPIAQKRSKFLEGWKTAIGHGGLSNQLFGQDDMVVFEVFGVVVKEGRDRSVVDVSHRQNIDLVIRSRQQVEIGDMIVSLYKPRGWRFVGNDMAGFAHKGVTAIAKKHREGGPSCFPHVYKARRGGASRRRSRVHFQWFLRRIERKIWLWIRNSQSILKVERMPILKRRFCGKFERWILRFWNCAVGRAEIHSFILCMHCRMHQMRGTTHPNESHSKRQTYHERFRILSVSRFHSHRMWSFWFTMDARLWRFHCCCCCCRRAGQSQSPFHFAHSNYYWYWYCYCHCYCYCRCGKVCLYRSSFIPTQNALAFVWSEWLNNLACLKLIRERLYYRSPLSVIVTSWLDNIVETLLLLTQTSNLNFGSQNFHIIFQNEREERKVIMIFFIL